MEECLQFSFLFTKLLIMNGNIINLKLENVINIADWRG